MSDWREIELQELAEVQTGPFGSQLKNEQYITGGTPVITVEHLKDFKIIDFDYPSVTEEDKNRLSKYLLKAGDIVFTRVGSVDLSAYIKQHQEGWMFSSRMLRVRPNLDIINARFLSYYFQQQNFRDYILNISVGATMPSINTGILKGIPISFPDLPQQQAIASILSSLDDKIDLLHRQNATLEKMAETLFRQWFVEEAKEEWEEVDLEYVTKRITDGAHNSPPTTEDGFPMASVKDMHDWGIHINSCRKICKDAYDELVRNDCRPLKHDIIIAKDGSYLKHVFVAPNDMDMVVLSSIAILRPNGKYNPMLLATYLKMESTIERLKNIVTGAVIPRIVLKDFRKFKIQLPPIEIQIEALKFIEPIYQKCWQNINQIHTLTQIRDTLLPKLMSGEVSVSNFGEVES
ncbi:restriction endonuclease subunit S [Algoriphagus sp.]|jgi:type I restriction enzyme S subunit|uniref:restriction endonuclease subunit S n=1 Tax=Algoriphagus sp. TaxID=1872435 RepID=UPI00271BC2E9|nr:restriction endonuclease subunit S [Algoriphagus sp.]MDO8967634.1 restriction endonuclease subunit S [Algoriphagus sp.]MDP3198565.1 restriction endonuclease subunit S [Algoriphagus sp.]